MEDTTALFYYEEDNYFVDEGGYIIYNIFSYISPSQLLLFKKHRTYMCVATPKGDVIELFHDGDILEQACNEYRFG